VSVRGFIEYIVSELAGKECVHCSVCLYNLRWARLLDQKSRDVCAWAFYFNILVLVLSSGKLFM
jgi:hypothetical protein